MTQPTDPTSDPTPTEPVDPASFAPPPAFAFSPVEPEPAGAMTGSAAGGAGRSGSGSRPLAIVFGAIILVGALGIAFAAGRASSPATDTAGGVSNRLEAKVGDDGTAGDRVFPDDDGVPGRGLGREGAGGLGLTGTVTAVDEDSLTLQLENGATVTVGIDGTTTYHQQAPAGASDVTVGDTVQVQVSGRLRPGRGADGSTDLGTARDITIVP
jgi:hypothetical protein